MREQWMQWGIVCVNRVNLVIDQNIEFDMWALL